MARRFSLLYSTHMRILIAAGIYPPETGGPATYAKAMADALPARGIAVDVLPLREARRYSPFHHIAYACMLFARAKDADIIFAQYSVSVGLAAFFVSRLRGKRFLIRVGGDYAWEQSVQRFGVKENLDAFVSGKHRYGLRIRIFQFLQSFIARRAEAIIVPSEYLKRVVLTWGVESSRIRVVYSAFIPEEIPESKEELGAFMDMPEVALVTSARLVQWKGVGTLVELMPELQKEFSGIGLVVVGDGPERVRLEQVAKDANVSDIVRFMGDVPHETALKYLKSADVFVLNTGYEGLSYTLLEAMAQGAPIVTTAVGGNPELIESGRDGILVQYDNKTELLAAIRGILTGSIDGAGLARAAKEKVHNFSQERMVDGTIAVLESLR